MTARTGTAPPHAGLRHVALYCHDLEATLAFYRDVMDMTVEWNPDPDNYYLTSGNDNLALHRAAVPATAGPGQRLDHIGFILDRPEHVDAWHERLLAAGVAVAQAPKTHRDGARSLYCRDPDGTVVQLIYHPPLAAR